MRGGPEHQRRPGENAGGKRRWTDSKPCAYLPSEDLERHIAVNYFWGTGRMRDFSFDVGGLHAKVRMKAHIAVNDAVAYLESGPGGMGIVQAAQFLAMPYLDSGALVEILPELKPVPTPISVVYPHSRHLSQAVRVFVDWIAQLFLEREVFA
jgi:LysR family transcriptional regulator for bpeEF and oprC